MKGQTWVEFIITTAVFLLAISFIFMTASGNIKEEIQKVQLQSSCIKAYELENFLRQPGIPSNWNSSIGFSVFGLSQGNNTPLIISDDKWQAMKNLSFANISLKATPSTSWNIGYDTYAFAFNPDSNCTLSNTISFCRVAGGPLTSPYVRVTVSSTLQSKTTLRLFFPLVTVMAGSMTNESNDVLSTSSANGTYVNLILNTNSTDNDTMALDMFSIPRLIFIDQINVQGGQNLPLYLGNSTIPLQDSFGASPPPNAIICDTKVSGLLNLTNESLLVDFNLEAW